MLLQLDAESDCTNTDRFVCIYVPYKNLEVERIKNKTVRIRGSMFRMKRIKIHLVFSQQN